MYYLKYLYGSLWFINISIVIMSSKLVIRLSLWKYFIPSFLFFADYKVQMVVYKNIIVFLIIAPPNINALFNSFDISGYKHQIASTKNL